MHNTNAVTYPHRHRHTIFHVFTQEYVNMWIFHVFTQEYVNMWIFALDNYIHQVCTRRNTSNIVYLCPKYNNYNDIVSNAMIQAHVDIRQPDWSPSNMDIHISKFKGGGGFDP